jgi:hypothetical protein
LGVCLPSARTEEGVSTLIGNAIRWAALAVLDGKTLTVRFNLVMQMSDFEDAICTLAE